MNLTIFMQQPFVPIALPTHPPLPEGAHILAADVGGTKTALALFHKHTGTLTLLKEAEYSSKKFGAMADFIRHFMEESPMPERLSIAFAGPVLHGRAKATNLSWSVDIKALGQELGIPETFLLNDLEASAYGIAFLTPEDFRVVHPVTAPMEGNVAIIAPGTGLGEAGMYWDGSKLHPFATEGGHTDFSPRSPFDWELLHHLQKIYGHVSWERLISGPGIHQIYLFLRDVKGFKEPDGMPKQMELLDPAAAIALGAKQDCALCVETLNLFVKYLAVEASNLALKLKSTGGIFIGGGIPPKIWNDDLQEVFLQSFFEVGRLRALMESSPVYLIKNPKTVLYGAAHYGA